MEEDKYRPTPVLKERKTLRTHAIPLVGGMFKPSPGALRKPLDFDTYEEYLLDWRERSFTKGQKPLDKDKWNELKKNDDKKKMLIARKEEQRREALGLPPTKASGPGTAPVRAVSEWVEPDVEDTDEEEEEQPVAKYRGTKKGYERFKKQ